MRVCMRVCMHAQFVHVCDAYMLREADTYTHACMHARTHARTYARTHAHAHMRAHTL